MPLTRIQLENFTAFRELDVELGAGIHAFLGANGTGKTHLLKLGYLAVSEPRRDKPTIRFDQLFSSNGFGRQVVLHRLASEASARVILHTRDSRFEILLDAESFLISTPGWFEADGGDRLDGTFIPAKEMLVNAPGFRSLYEAREVHFDATYVEIIDRAFRPPLRQLDPPRQQLLDRLEGVLGGAVGQRGETFFLEAPFGALPFDLVGEGLRKIALLWLLIKNGTVGREDTVLFWDEPEANLNPGLMRVVVETLLGLQRLGTQLLVATHDYALLKELELQAESDDAVTFHVLYRDVEGDVRHTAGGALSDLDENPIAEAYGELLHRDLRRALDRTKTA